jgi:putative intracellular protease/amidase
MTTKKIMLVCTSANSMAGAPTGAWLEEIATPFYAMKNAGMTVEIVSIAGGVVPIDPASEAGDFFTDDCKTFYADEDALAALKNSKKLGDVDQSEYDGIYLAGGHGTCADFLNNAELTAVIEAQYAAGKPVAADCHGPIALLSCKKPDGTPLLAGTEATCFTDAEETAVGLNEKVPVLLETEFRKLGCKFNGGADWSPNAVCDKNLVTGQNPASSKPCVDLFLKLFA